MFPFSASVNESRPCYMNYKTGGRLCSDNQRVHQLEQSQVLDTGLWTKGVPFHQIYGPLQQVTGGNIQYISCCIKRSWTSPASTHVTAPLQGHQSLCHSVAIYTTKSFQAVCPSVCPAAPLTVILFSVLTGMDGSKPS